MFERFTSRVRRVVVVAQEEARLLGHDKIGTEHLLLALIAQDGGVAVAALANLAVVTDEIRTEVLDLIGSGSGSPDGYIQFTPRAKKVLEMALREALQLGHNFIGTEHLLLGMIREGEGVAATVLARRGLDLSTARHEVINILGIVPTAPDTSPLSAQDAALAQGRGSSVQIDGYATSISDEVLQIFQRALELVAGGAVLPAHIRQALDES